MSAPKISIVIPVYLPTQYLYEVLQSVREQTYQDYEIVISDDTPDANAALNIISRFADLPVRYMQNESGKGIFSNLNNAIRNSSGSFIQIFCQDDRMKPHFLEEQLKTFNSFPTAGLVFCGLDEIDEKGNVIPSIPFFTEPIKNWNSFLPKSKAYNYLFVFGCLPRNLSPVMLRKEVIEEIGLFNQAFPFAGDYEYWIRVAERYDFAFNKKSLLFVRSHKQRASNTIGLMKLVPEAAFLYRKTFENNTVSAPEYRKQLQVNNLMVSHFLSIAKKVFSGKFRYFKLFRYCQVAPFKISTLLFIKLQRIYRRKVSWFISEVEC